MTRRPEIRESPAIWTMFRLSAIRMEHNVAASGEIHFVDSSMSAILVQIC